MKMTLIYLHTRSRKDFNEMNFFLEKINKKGNQYFGMHSKKGNRLNSCTKVTSNYLMIMK